MPALARPSIPIPGVAVDILGANQARVAILIWLSQHPGSTITEIQKGLEVSRMSVTEHVRALSAAGAIISTPLQPARGQRARYELVPAVVQREVITLLAQMGIAVDKG